MDLIVTAYESPDLDGVACAFAYAEFLQKKGIDAIVAISGNPHREAQFVLNRCSIPSFPDADNLFSIHTRVVLVDASDLSGISKHLNPKAVIEIIDHRKAHDSHCFPNAKAQIELVGAAATLIAEKFFKENMSISKESAALLFSAIVSNTINFQAGVTTERDKRMATWLMSHVPLPKNYVQDMFSAKSTFDQPMKDVFLSDFARFVFSGKNVGIVQLEIVGASSFIDMHDSEIRKALEDIREEETLDSIFLTLIDLEQAYNELVVIDDISQALLESSLSVSFKNERARHSPILMRKEIVPKIKALFSL